MINEPYKEDGDDLNEGQNKMTAMKDSRRGRKSTHPKNNEGEE